MNRQIDLNLVLDEWLSDGPNTAHDRVLEAVADLISEQPQRSAWRLHWRTIAMNPTVKVAATLAAAIAIFVAGISILPRIAPGIGAGPGETPRLPSAGSPSPSPAASQSATAGPSPTIASWVAVTPNPSNACEDDIPGCSGRLQAGLHRSWQLDPGLWYVVPTDGWINSIDSPSVFKLDLGSDATPYVLVWVNPGIAEQTPTCENIAQPGGRDAAAWREFLTSTEGLVVSTPVPVDLGGSLDSNGFEVDVELDPNWTTMCGDWPYPQIPFISHDLNGSEAAYGVDTQQRLHLTVVDGPDVENAPSTMVIEVYGPLDRRSYDVLVGVAKDVISTFRFDCGVSLGNGPCEES